MGDAAPAAGGAQIAFVSPMVSEPTCWATRVATRRRSPTPRRPACSRPRPPWSTCGSPVRSSRPRSSSSGSAPPVVSSPPAVPAPGHLGRVRLHLRPDGAEGSRITGMWLDGAAIVRRAATRSRSARPWPPAVTTSGCSPMGRAAGRRPAGGCGPGRVPRTATPGDPLVPGFTQHSVGVAFPGGAKASYGAGDGPRCRPVVAGLRGGLRPEGHPVDVSLGGRSLGSFPVDNTLGHDRSDETARRPSERPSRSTGRRAGDGEDRRQQHRDDRGAPGRGRRGLDHLGGGRAGCGQGQAGHRLGVGDGGLGRRHAER